MESLAWTVVKPVGEMVLTTALSAAVEKIRSEILKLLRAPPNKPNGIPEKFTVFFNNLLYIDIYFNFDVERHELLFNALQIIKWSKFGEKIQK